MRLPDLFKPRGQAQRPAASVRVIDDTGIILVPRPETAARTDAFVMPLASIELPALCDQLLDDGYATHEADSTLIPWDAFYSLTTDAAFQSSLHLLALPAGTDIVPALQSRGSLTDKSFEISIAGWRDQSGVPVMVRDMRGAVVDISGEMRVLSQSVWRLVDHIGRFHRRTDAERSDTHQRRQWGLIRRTAIEAGAHLDDFLLRTVVLAPEKLDIAFRKSAAGDMTVIEIAPSFDGAPDGWLDAFDRAAGVPERYDIATRGGVVQVLTTPEVKSVLRSIKSLPGRRLAGQRADAFLLNPFAALGEDATTVIDEQQFEAAKVEAGISFERFRPLISRNALAYPIEVGIEVDDSNGGTERHLFNGDAELEDFVDGLERRLARGQQLYGWGGYQLELLGDAADHLALLQAVIRERKAPPILISRERIYDLSAYTDRVAEIGRDRPFISPYIVKRNENEGWFPENLLPFISFAARDGFPAEDVPIAPKDLDAFRQNIEAARASGQSEVHLPGSTRSVPFILAAEMVAAIEKGLVSPAPKPPRPTDSEAESARRPSLVIKGNIDALDHSEHQSGIATETAIEAERPRALKSDVKLREHQVVGLARLQQLFRLSPDSCRGVLLADDMGLGKTIQLLMLMAWAFERSIDLPPALVVAPVSLLENWQEEIERFFKPQSLRVLTAYGDNLRALRVQRDSIDPDLRDEGLVRFLKPDWRGSAQIVLTTYETLRDLEFSFAVEPWSILVCDEAQKIKNPNALVTRAAKKQKVRFRVACTGTPVENTLADLWCLFDFVQPGLLGSLDEFGKAYGRPIETIEQDAPAKLAELRQQIDPQLIRRTKREVAKDLPSKIDVPKCEVPLSTEQRGLYVGALELFSRSSSDQESDGRIHHLGLLQHLRLICADPRQYGVETFVPEPSDAYRRKAPKMDWLAKTLHAIKGQGEKALVFAEHRDVQRLLQHYIGLELGFRPEIVNGDTSVSSKATTSRQKKLKEFQAIPGFAVIILSPLAVGFGVNIQAANHVIHYLRHWNPAKEDQATDRAYRIGQTKPVYVYCPLTVAKDFKTFDVKLNELLSLKRALATDMLRGAGGLSGMDFDLRDIAPDGPRHLNDEPITSEVLERMAPSFFEAFIAALWRKQGFNYVKLTPQSDAGVDVIALRGASGVLIQCKSSARQGAKLSWDAVKEVVGGTAVYAELYPGVSFSRICVTNQSFNSTAHQRAKANGVAIVEQDALLNLLQGHPLTKLDVMSRCWTATGH